MTLKTLGPMLSEINALLQARGCKVTEMSVTFHPLEGDGALESGDLCLWLDQPPQAVPSGRGSRQYRDRPDAPHNAA